MRLLRRRAWQREQLLHAGHPPIQKRTNRSRNRQSPPSALPWQEICQTLLLLLLPTALILGAAEPTPARRQVEQVEEVMLERTLRKDLVVFIRQNGTAWVAEIGIGCPDPSRRQGERLLVRFPKGFGDPGGVLIFPKEDQYCRIWALRAARPAEDTAPTLLGP